MSLHQLMERHLAYADLLEATGIEAAHVREDASYLFQMAQTFDAHMALCKDEDAQQSCMDWFSEEYDLNWRDDQTRDMFRENSEHFSRLMLGRVL